MNLQELQKIVSKEVKFAEKMLQATSGENKKGIVQISVENALTSLYDHLDQQANLPPVVDRVSKESLIPLIADLIDQTVAHLNEKGWGAK